MSDDRAANGITPRQAATTFYEKWRAARMMVSVGVLAVAIVLAGLVWFKNTFLSIDPGKGAPLGMSVRTDRHIATLMQTLEPYTPSPNRDHSKDTYGVSLFIVPLDGTTPSLVPISGGHSGNSLGLAKVLGSDGAALWYDVKGVGAVNLSTMRRIDGAGTTPPANLRGTSQFPLKPRVESSLAAGFFTGTDTWLGLLSPAQADRSFKPKQWLRAIVHADNAKEMRRFYRGTVGDVSSTGSRQILSMDPIGDATYLNAALLRVDDTSEPIRMRNPDGALMIYTSAPGLAGTLVAARVDLNGVIVWQTDTAIDRFKQSQILPGGDSVAFVGTRLPVPGKVPEPLLVIVDNATGAAATHSLWR